MREELQQLLLMPFGTLTAANKANDLEFIILSAANTKSTISMREYSHR